MRNFDEADKKKKRARIHIQENPGNLSPEALSQLGEKVKASLQSGNLSCATAFKIALDAGVPKVAVGEVTDRLGIRIANCQIGCFKVDKAVHDNLDHVKIDDGILATLETLNKNNELTCANVFELAMKLKTTPRAIANVANLKNLKVRHCQLGCF